MMLKQMFHSPHEEKPTGQPPQHQDHQPGTESEMVPNPQSEDRYYRASGKLQGKKAIITGGDSGIGKSVAILYAKEGADVAILYLNEHEDANETKRQVEEEGQRCLLFPGDVGDETFCRQAVQQVVAEFGSVDVLVNNAAEQHPKNSIEEIDQEQLEKTFRSNIFSCFYMTKAVLPHMKNGSTIINTTSVTAYKGNDHLIDYSCTKGAMVAFTRSLSESLVSKGIRVNGVAPGPIWTPLIPSTFDAKHVGEFGKNTPMGRPGQPDEVAPSYVFLASDDSSYISGQMIHVNGGIIVSS